MKQWFNRNMQARDDLEILLVSAVSSLLLVRFYLYIAGYPQLGSGSLHIAHMLYGGIFMLIAIVILISFIGRRVQRVAALIGGIGFGLFIDELGKFITRDNNYFFEPAIGLIYAVFIILYLSFNFLTRRTQYRNAEYQLNVLHQFEEAVIHHMDRNEKGSIIRLLNDADQTDQLNQQLRAIVNNIRTVAPHEESRINHVLNHINHYYRKFWQQRSSSRLVAAIFIVEAVLFLGALFGTLINNFEVIDILVRGGGGYTSFVIAGQIVSTVVAAAFAVVGAVRLTQSRLEGFEWFRRATLVNLLLTEFFIFSRIEFGAIPGFVANLALLIALNFAISQERRASHITD